MRNPRRLFRLIAYFLGLGLLAVIIYAYSKQLGGQAWAAVGDTAGAAASLLGLVGLPVAVILIALTTALAYRARR